MKLKVIAILTAILFIVVMSVQVYADTTIPPLPIDAWEYWVIVNIGDIDEPVIRLYTSHNPIKVTEPNHYRLEFDTYRRYRYPENGWELYDEGLERKSVYFTSMYAANHDIAYADESGFFFESPKVPPLSQATRTMDFGTILRNFSAGLIPILGLLILAISLAKGWGFLRTQLKH